MGEDHWRLCIQYYSVVSICTLLKPWFYQKFPLIYFLIQGAFWHLQHLATTYSHSQDFFGVESILVQVPFDVSTWLHHVCLPVAVATLLGFGIPINLRISLVGRDIPMYHCLPLHVKWRWDHRCDKTLLSTLCCCSTGRQQAKQSESKVTASYTGISLLFVTWHLVVLMHLQYILCVCEWVGTW